MVSQPFNSDEDFDLSYSAWAEDTYDPDCPDYWPDDETAANFLPDTLDEHDGHA